MTNILYKLRHKPTGLFYKPTIKKYGVLEDQLVKKGKLYKVYPDIAIEWIMEHGVIHLAEVYHFKPCEWEVVYFRITEIGAKDVEPESDKPDEE